MARVTYLKTATEAPDGAVQAILESTVRYLKDCAGGCGQRLLSSHQWGKLTKPIRAELRELNVTRRESDGACWNCAPAVIKAAGVNRKPRPANVIRIQDRVDFPAEWARVCTAGGSYGDLARELKVTPEYVRQVVKELELPQVDKRREDTEEREVFIEEMERLVLFGQGIHRISRAFSLTENELVEKVGKLRMRGLTEVRFDYYTEMAA